MPKEIQNEILDYVIVLSTNKELLELSSTCKLWYNRISNNSSWLDERLKSHYSNIRNDAPEPDQDARHREYEADLLGADHVFSPKISFYFIKHRSDTTKLRIGARFRISPDLFGVKDKKLYVPWMDHNLLRRPDTFWSLIKTLLICPKWIYTFFMAKNRSSKRSLVLDRSNSQRISFLFGVLSVREIYIVILATYIIHDISHYHCCLCNSSCLTDFAIVLAFFGQLHLSLSRLI